MKNAGSNLSGKLFRILSWALFYYIVNRLSLNYFLTSEGVAIAWPPIGVFISAIILSGAKERPYIIVVLFLADFVADLHTNVPYFSKLLYALLSTGDATISAYVLLRVAGEPFTFSKARNILMYVLLSVIICNGLFSILVALVTHLVQGSGFFTGFLYSWVADGVGNIMVVPLIISWSKLYKSDFSNVRRKHFLEIIILIVLLISLNVLLFPYSNDGLMFSFIINYLSFPFIIWAIFRFDMKIVTMVLILLTSVMLFNLIRNTAVLTDPNLNRHFMFFQLYVASIAIITLLITAVRDERNLAHLALIESEHKYRTVADYTYAWEYWIDENKSIRYMSPAVEEITGYKANAFMSEPLLLDEIIYPDDRLLWEKHKKDNSEKISKLEFRIVSRDNTVKWIGHDCRQIYNGQTFLGLRVSNRDITALVEAERKLLLNTVETEERERSRYSRELHDGLGPLLSTIKMYIQSLSETKESKKLKLFADESNNIIKIAIQTMREIAHGMAPFNLSNSGYVEAMNDFIEKLNKVPSLGIDFEFNSKIRFSNFYEIMLYRITTELINNTLKHAGATRIQITYNFHKERRLVSLNYHDNGRGFDKSIIRKNEKGMGLATIQHRLKMLRGQFKIDSLEGKGVTIHIEFPIHEKDIRNAVVSELY